MDTLFYKHQFLDFFSRSNNEDCKWKKRKEMKEGDEKKNINGGGVLG